MKQLISFIIGYSLAITLLFIQAYGGTSKPSGVDGTHLSALPVMKPLQQLNYASQEEFRIYYPENTYAAGNCTFLAKSERLDIPNTFGNAIDWLANAQAQGFPTGTIPKVGAVVWFNTYGLGHVAILKQINPDGTLLVEEENVLGLGVISHRTIPNENIMFIY